MYVLLGHNSKKITMKGRRSFPCETVTASCRLDGGAEFYVPLTPSKPLPPVLHMLFYFPLVLWVIMNYTIKASSLREVIALCSFCNLLQLV